MENNFQNEIKYNDLIDKAKDLSSKDLHESEHTINLVLISPGIDEHSKITSWALKSFLHLKLKTQNELLAYYKKAVKYSSQKGLNKLEPNSAFCIIRIMFRTGTILQDAKNLYLAAKCFFEAKNIFEEKDIRTERESYETLERSFSEVLKDIGGDVYIC
jgi:hypothetical protein